MREHARRFAQLALLPSLLCCAPPLPAPEVELLNAALISDPGARRWYGEHALPVLRIRQPHAEIRELRLGPPYAPAAVAFERQTRGPFTLLRVTKAAPVQGATARLELQLRDREVGWEIGWERPAADHPRLVEAARLRREDAEVEALALLRGAATSTEARLAIAAARELARIDRAAARPLHAEASWRAAAKRAESGGLWSEAGSAWRALAFQQIARGAHLEAEVALSQSDQACRRAADPRGLMLARYYRGLGARARGTHAAAKRHLEQAAREAFELGADQERAAIHQILANEHAASGRHDEALALFDRLSEAIPARYEGEHWANRAWVQGSAMLAGALPWDLDALAADYQRAQASFEARGLEEQALAPRIRLAWLEVRGGAPERARARVDGVLGGDALRLGRHRWYARLLAAELRWAEGSAREAEEQLTGLLRDLELFGEDHREETILALEALGRIQAGMGRAREAADTGRRALSTIAESARQTSLHRSRSAYLWRWASLHEEAVERLLRVGRVEEAFATVEWFRSRVSDAFDAGLLPARAPEAWTAFEAQRASLEAERQARCGAGGVASGEEECRELLARERAVLEEAFLGLEQPHVASPLEDATWIGRLSEALGPGRALISVLGDHPPYLSFLVRSDGVRYQRADEPILAWWPELQGQRHVFVVPGANRRAFDAPVARTPSGQPLAVELGVSLLPHAAWLLRPRPRAAGAPLVIGDPDEDLPAARLEATRVARVLGGEPLIGASASRSAVLERWSGRKVVHFAGHGVLLDRDPWSARLELAGPDVLFLEDICIHRPAIDLVLLNGCATGVEARDHVVGLPQAFLLSGTRAVVATVTGIGDVAARRFVADYFAAGGADAPARAYRQVATAWERRRDASWQAYRVWGLPD